MAAKPSKKRFRVTSVIEVDHPEQRNESYAPVRAGHRITNRTYFDDQGAATRFADRLLTGEDDFASEYVATVYVDQLAPDSDAIVRTVRKRVERRRSLKSQHATKKSKTSKTPPKSTRSIDSTLPAPRPGQMDRYKSTGQRIMDEAPKKKSAAQLDREVAEVISPARERSHASTKGVMGPKEALPFHTSRCYACDDKAVGVRDRRPEGGLIEAACARHRDASLRAFPACQFCSGARPSLVIDGDFAHKSCHEQAIAD